MAVEDKGISFLMKVGELKVIGAGTRDDEAVHVLLAQQTYVSYFTRLVLRTLEDHPVALLMGQVAHTAQESRKESISALSSLS